MKTIPQQLPSRQKRAEIDQTVKQHWVNAFGNPSAISGTEKRTKTSTKAAFANAHQQHSGNSDRVEERVGNQREAQTQLAFKERYKPAQTTNAGCG